MKDTICAKCLLSNIQVDHKVELSFDIQNIYTYHTFQPITACADCASCHELILFTQGFSPLFTAHPSYHDTEPQKKRRTKNTILNSPYIYTMKLSICVHCYEPGVTRK